MDPGDERVVDGRAWHEFCDRLAALGDRILEPDFPGTPRDRAEGFRHLANQVVGWLGWAIGYPDPAYPAFFRQNDLVVRWGGPNVDQVTRRARVAADGVYRVAGCLGTCEDFILTVKNGDMHMERYGILHEVMASELGIGAGDDFELVLAADEAHARGSRWVPLHADATMINVREYYFDWRPGPPATIAIERLDTQGTAPPPLTPGALAGMLDEALALAESSVVYWNDYMRRAKAELPPNTMGTPRHNAGGSSRIHYSFGFFELATDDALLIEAGPPDARFWDVQLYSMGWFETLDFANRVTSLNHNQGHLSSDGRFRAVVAHHDPGVPNWL
ncbi:MAG TPA: hypothetical protein VFC99_11825, partial [Acidimicrobiia bacterium]|nr:hypothetical protein [Acidimicrobiia bacterium]